jgi:pre-mRNA-splicing helicase BRR2
MVQIELTLVSAFQSDVDSHGYSQLFHIIVEDLNGESILHHQTFTLKKKSVDEEHIIVVTVPVMDPLAPAYFIRVISDHWLHSEATLSISLNQTTLPDKFQPPTELLDLQPLLVTAVGETTFAKLFPFKDFNLIQTQTFHGLFKTSRNTLVCAASGSRKMALADFAILRLTTANASTLCQLTRLPNKLTPIDGGCIMKSSQIMRLLGEAAADMTHNHCRNSEAVGQSLSCRWKQRKALHTIALLFFLLSPLGWRARSNA